MSTVQRICVQCGQAYPLDARYCGHCGHDAERALPAQQNNLPVVLGRAALPVLVGAAGLAVRAGWRLLQSQWARDLAKQALQAAQTRATTPKPDTVRAHPNTQPPKQAAHSPGTQVSTLRAMTPTSAVRAKRTLHIRSAWRVSDGQGNTQQGVSEHTIEIED